MRNETEYVEMACACGAEWIEDRGIPLGPDCPYCGHSETWNGLYECDQLFMTGPATPDLPLDQLQAFMDRAAFLGSAPNSNRAFYDSVIWTYQHPDDDAIYHVLLEATVFRRTGIVRSLKLTYRAGGVLALDLMVNGMQELVWLLAAIVRTWKTELQLPVRAAAGVFCGGHETEG